ncbi:MAG: S8 family peptidase [Pseudomonadota bacterium]
MKIRFLMLFFSIVICLLTIWKPAAAISGTSPNDSLFSQQWGLNNINTLDADINILEAWDIEPGDPNVIVAIIDMGFDLTHSDLQNNLWKNPGEIPENGIDDDRNGYIDDIIGWDFVNQSEGDEDDGNDYKDEDNDPTLSQSSHGNEVFGVIGATMNNAIGIAGVTGRCKMMLIRAGYINTQGKAVLSGSSIIKGIIYATDNGASIINISSGSNKYSNSYHDVLKYAIDHGVVITCSAGNEGSNTPVYPAAYSLDGLISVGASTDEDQPARFSNWGDWVDVSAPGQHIVSTMNNDRYGQIHGTSFSAPIVAGIAALLVSHYPDWTPAQIHDRIMATVDVRESLKDANATSGRVNAYRALLNTDINDAGNTGGGNNATNDAEQPAPAVSANDDGGGGCFLSITRESSLDRFFPKGVFE